VWPKK